MDLHFSHNLQRLRSNSAVWLVLVFILFVMFPLLGDRPISGWDLVPQYHLFASMSDNFAHELRATFYDTLWFAGFPAFTFYGPLPYLFGAAVHWILSFAVLPIFGLSDTSIFRTTNIYLLLLAVSFLFAFIRAAKELFPRDVKSFAALSAFLFLTHLGYTPALNVGLFGGLLHGHLAEFFGTILFLLIIAEIERFRRFPSRGRAVLLGVLYGSLALSHTITFILASSYAAVYLFFSGRSLARQFVPVAIIGVIVAGSWLWNMYSLLGYSSGQALDYVDIDPLLATVSGFAEIRAIWHGKADGAGLWAFPYSALLVAICGIVGLLGISRQNTSRFAATYLVLLLLLPRNIFGPLLALPLHYYRFNGPLVLLFYLAVPTGLSILFSYVDVTRRKLGECALTGLIGLSVMGNAQAATWSVAPDSFWAKFRGIAPARNLLEMGLMRSDSDRLETMPVDSKHYPLVTEANKLIDRVAADAGPKRVLASVDYLNDRRLGSPHYFNAFFPLKHGIEVIPGLLAESAYSHSFINGYAARFLRSLDWGRNEYRSSLMAETFQSAHLLDVLRVYGISHVIASSSDAIADLRELNPEIEFTERAGPFSLFRVTEPRPLVGKTVARPFLYVNRESGIDFRTLSERIFRDPTSFDFPVIWTPRPVEEISAADGSGIGGILLAVAWQTEVRDEDLKHWGDRPVAVLNGEYRGERSTVRSWKNFSLERDMNDVFDFMKRFGRLRDAEEAVPFEMSGSRIRFQANGPTVIRYSFFPNWQSAEPRQTVFLMAPSFLFVVGREGETLLEYR